MKMKSLSAAMLTLTILSGATVAQAATVSGGTVHFTGEVVNAACAVSPNSADQTVKLGQVRAASLTDAGSVANQTPFNIVLADCDTTVSTSASVSFNGPATTAGDALSVSSISTNGVAATNVGIQILDQSGTVIKPNTAVGSTAFTLQDGVNTIPFTAQFVSTAGGATAGAADADATFNIEYN
ncbi:type 1 fimbrial major subunit FimA [Klebsiella aerogenes]